MSRTSCQSRRASRLPDLEDGRLLARLDQGDLLGEVGGDEHLAPPGPLVVEGPGADRPQPEAPVVLPAEHVLRHLGHGVGRQRPQRVLLGDRRLLGVDEPVLLRRAGDLHRHVGQPEVPHRLEQVHLAQHVGHHRVGRARSTRRGRSSGRPGGRWRRAGPAPAGGARRPGPAGRRRPGGPGPSMPVMFSRGLRQRTVPTTSTSPRSRQYSARWLPAMPVMPVISTRIRSAPVWSIRVFPEYL